MMQGRTSKKHGIMLGIMSASFRQFTNEHINSTNSNIHVQTGFDYKNSGADKIELQYFAQSDINA